MALQRYKAFHRALVKNCIFSWKSENVMLVNHFFCSTRVFNNTVNIHPSATTSLPSPGGLVTHSSCSRSDCSGSIQRMPQWMSAGCSRLWAPGNTPLEQWDKGAMSTTLKKRQKSFWIELTWYTYCTYQLNRSLLARFKPKYLVTYMRIILDEKVC